MNWPAFLSSKTERFFAAAWIAAAILCSLLIRILKIRSDVNNEIAHPDRNLTAFLMLIRWCEGTDGPQGYNTIFGYKYFSSFADHPRINNQGSTAAGAYQFLAGTWDECRLILGLKDFSPASQDKAAIYLIDKKRKALNDVKEGRLSDAIQKCALEWASMPVVHTVTDRKGKVHPAGSSYYGGQPSRTLAQIRQKFAEFGGTAKS